jgi:hypothetical protein
MWLPSIALGYPRDALPSPSIFTLFSLTYDPFWCLSGFVFPPTPRMTCFKRPNLEEIYFKLFLLTYELGGLGRHKFDRRRELDRLV